MIYFIFLAGAAVVASAVAVVLGWLSVPGGGRDFGAQWHSAGILLCKRCAVTNAQDRVIVPPFVVGGEDQFCC